MAITKTGAFIETVQALVEAVEFTLQGFDTGSDLLALSLPAWRPSAVGEQTLQLFADATDNRLAVAVDVIEHNDALAQTFSHQAFVHHF
ncbi:hypothetical protein D3C85_1143780 [compost metagenome]